MDLNDKQKEAVEHAGGPLLIVAGAGSGKTKTLTSRLYYLLKKGTSPENIIAITFTNKAADEMKKRVEKMLNLKKEFNDLFIGTFHSLGVRILKKEAKFFGRNSNFSIFDDDDSFGLIKNIVKNFNFSSNNFKFSPASLRRQFSKIKNEFINVYELDEDIKILFFQYERALEKNNAFDFDDLIQKPVEIFQKDKNILEKYMHQFQHILVDEYQDTNTAQYLFIKLLAQKNRNISVVGDDQQAIYKFRGSDFRNFLNFDHDWPDAKVVFLEQNYRSSGNIIKAASGMISHNKYQKPKQLWTQNYDGELVKVIEHEDEAVQAGWVAARIGSAMNDSDKSIAVLYRTNAQSRAIETALIEAGISYKIFGGIKFYQRYEIKDIIAALRCLSNPKDSMSLDRLKKNFLKKDFAKIEADFLNKEVSLKNFAPINLINQFLEVSNYFNLLKKNYGNFQERIENINELIYFASEFNDLGEFLERVSLLQSSESINESKKINISLMTIHLSKGLEFDSVFLIGASEGLLPHQMSLSLDDEMEEERRLMYVAMTRAKNNLYLNFYHIPSRFLYEIPPELVEFNGKKSLDDEERYIEI